MRFREIESMILEDGWYQVKQKVHTTNTNTRPNLEKSRSQNMEGFESRYRKNQL